MREEHDWPDWDTDPVPKAVPQAFSAYPRAADDDELLDELFEPEPRQVQPTTGKRVRRGVGRAFVMAGLAAVAFVVLYAADLFFSVGEVPRGVTVSGVEVGGLNPSAAEDTLRRELEPRLTEPISVRAGDVNTTLEPTDAGLSLDWRSTVEQAGSQPLNPLTRIASFFTSREVGVVSRADDQQLRKALQTLAEERIDHRVVEGGIGFHSVEDDGSAVRPFAIRPKDGQRLSDVDGAMTLVKRGWLNHATVDLPVAVTSPVATLAGVRAALRQAEPLVSGPVTLQGEGRTAVLTPRDIGAALRFAPVGGGGLELTLDRGRLQASVRPQLAGTERQPKDAALRLVDNGPSIEPAEQGRRINWERTFQPFLDVAGRQDARDLGVAYDLREPEVTTEAVADLGIKEVIGEFSTGGASEAAAPNLATMAAAVNGAIVRPGETFSLDARTGPRTGSRGYTVAPANEDGTGADVLGGGVSQFTSTLYNAAYLAGLTDAGHTPHEHYDERYPLARDAISLRSDGSGVDLAFTNNLRKAVAISASSGGSGVTVKIWGTRQYRVEVSEGSRTGLEPPDVRREEGPDCTPSRGEFGFTVSATRVRYEVDGGREAGRETQQVRYAPKPVVLCAPGRG
ncbi:VanW family protein [Prauserella cavernicola]|uniref:VanW family protein n=1 Tax=Prauserella cavernicola TaxID=2800127 RepID=A0A934QQE6_9PSEU|nr:VanW family protein [Prauserella cavernicola]MBK1784700.1 VanW family protein [Prauserella cavernicola]